MHAKTRRGQVVDEAYPVMYDTRTLEETIVCVCVRACVRHATGSSLEGGLAYLLNLAMMCARQANPPRARLSREKKEA
jgi:hypothetical protein